MGFVNPSGGTHREERVNASGEQEAVQGRREEEMAREEDLKARERKVKLKLEMQVGTC